jgi:factor associated with neutral sphingomyelinase activation
MYITNKNIYFQPMYVVSAKPFKMINIDKVKVIYKRRYELMDIGLEVIMHDQKAHYFAFVS